MLSFDLLGLGAAKSHVTLHDVRLLGDQPIANSDTAVLDEDASATGNLRLNDVTVGSPIAQVQLVRQPAHGRLTVANDGAFSYQPDANFFGADSFSYRIVDAAGHVSKTAQVNLTLRPVNDAPVAPACRDALLGMVHKG